MDENVDSFTQFELLLQQKTLKKPLSIYKDHKALNLGGKTCMPNEVISSVAATLKVMKSSETVKINKNVRGNLDKYKRNVLLPLTKLDIEEIQPKPSTSKFDTQCFTDTQLVDIVNKAEAIGVDTQNQIVNEFDTSFTKKQQVDDTIHFDTSIEVTSQVCGVVCDDIKDSHGDRKGFNENRGDVTETIDARDSDEERNANDEQMNESFDSRTSNERVNIHRNDIMYIDEEKYRHINDTDKTLNFNAETTDINKIEKVTDQTYNVDERMVLDSNTKVVIDNDTSRQDLNTLHNLNTQGNHEKIKRNEVVKDHVTYRQDTDTTDANKQPNLEDIDINEPPSPILSISSKKSFHMVYDLRAFEEFENIMRTVMENESDELQSQILGNNVIDNIRYDSESIDNKTQTELSSSPILDNKILDDIVSSNETVKNNILKSSTLGEDVKPIERTEICDDKTEIELSLCPILDNALLDDITSSNEAMKNIDTESNNEIHFSSSPILNRPAQSQSPVIPAIDILTNDRKISDIDFLQDEILFSSDEESDYIHKENQELPFTCVLETSFYTNQSDLLDKTMYVDFDRNTGTDSYMQAKSYFEGIQLSVLELVEKQDRLNVNKNDVLCDMRAENQISGRMSLDTSNGSMDNVISDVNAQEKPFVGFKTASNKNIELTDKSRSRIKQVFQDIDLGDDFLNVEPKTSDFFGENGPTTCKNPKDNILEDKVELEEFNESKMDIDFSELDRLEIVNMENNKTPIKFKGFTTASNKNIKISDTALAITKKVFKDINLTENLDTDHINVPKTMDE